MLRSFLLLPLLLLATAGAPAPVHRDTPWPELKKLDYFLGDWFDEANVLPGPFGAGGRVTMTDHREWMDGGFFIVVHSTFTALKGDGTGISFIGYDPNTKLYTYDEFYSQGEADHSKGRLEGDTWTWDMGYMRVGAKMMQARNVYRIISPTRYTTRYEISADSGKTWTLAMEGTGKKLSIPPTR